MTGLARDFRQTLLQPVTCARQGGPCVLKAWVFSGLRPGQALKGAERIGKACVYTSACPDR